MRLILLLFAVVAATTPVRAAPEAERLELTEPGAREAPRFDPTCEALGLVAVQSRVIGTVRATIAHGCERVATTQLWLRTADRWLFAELGFVAFDRADRGMNITIELAREDLGSGKLADGTRALVHSIETLHGRGAHPLRFGRVQVCAVDVSVQCSEPVIYACEEDACSPPRLSKGTLVVKDADLGTRRFSLQRGLK